MAANATPYAETEILLAIMNEDPERANELASDFMPKERRVFLEQLHETVKVMEATA